MLGHLGKLIAPVVRPLGWDWRIGCSVIASFPAREVVIGAMGVIYNLGDGQDEESDFAQRGTGSRNMARHRSAHLHGARGPVDHGLLCPLCTVCRDAGRHQERNGQLAMAAVHVCLHDLSGLRRCAADLSDRYVVELLTF